MALTIVPLATLKTSDNETQIVNITFDSSYPTGGEALTAAELGLHSILGCVIGGINAVRYHAGWDQANKKLMLYQEDGTSGIEAQVANASDQSAVTVTCLFVGK